MAFENGLKSSLIQSTRRKNLTVCLQPGSRQTSVSSPRRGISTGEHERSCPPAVLKDLSVFPSCLCRVGQLGRKKRFTWWPVASDNCTFHPLKEWRGRGRNGHVFCCGILGICVICLVSLLFGLVPPKGESTLKSEV